MTLDEQNRRSIKPDSRRELVMKTQQRRGFDQAGAGPKCVVSMSGLIHLGWTTTTLHRRHTFWSSVLTKILSVHSIYV